MSQPPAFSRAFSFTNFQASNPALALPGSQVDLELNNAKATLDAVLANLRLVQRDDGAVANASIGLDQLKTEVPLGFNVPQVWLTGTAYTVGSSTVFNGSGYYRCLITHTSGVFATDLAALKWQLIVNLAAVPLVNASQIAVTPSGVLTTDAQTSLQALDAGKAPLSHSQLSSTISDSTVAGRALLTAPDVATQNSLLGITLLGFQPGDIKETSVLVLPTGWYYADGSNKNRVTDAALFNAITIQQSCITTNASAIVTVTDTTNGGNTPMSPGMSVSGTGIPGGAIVQSVDSATQVTLSAAATTSATSPLVFAPFGVGDGSSTFGLPNKAYPTVGRDNASGSATNILQVSTTIGTTSGSVTATVASATGLFVGMYVQHPKIGYGTKIASISGLTITLTTAATATVALSAVRFSPLRDAQSVGATGGSMSQTLTLATLPTGITSANASVALSVQAAGANKGFPVTSGKGNVTTTIATGGTAIAPASTAGSWTGEDTMTGTANVVVTSNNTGAQATQTFSPTMVNNFIIKR